MKRELFASLIIGICWFTININATKLPNIVEALKDPAIKHNLTKFQEWIAQDQLISVVLAVRPCTVFAPTDEAFEKYERETGKDLTKKNLASLHTIGTMVLPEHFPTKTASYNSASPSLYLLTKRDPNSNYYNPKVDYYVNNAKIIGKPKIIENENKEKQVLYIIDEIIAPYERRPLPPTALEAIYEAKGYAQITNTDDIEKFASAILKNQLNDTYRRAGFHTYFVPIRINDKAEKELDETVLKGHIIPDQALFLRTTENNMPYKALAYDGKAKVELSFITTHMNDSINTVYNYIQSNVLASNGKRLGIVKVKIHRANVPVTNGVIHFIEKPLMIVQDNLRDVLRIEGPGQLSEFIKKVSNHEDLQTRLSGTSLTTLLAPTDEAFRRVEHIIKNLTYQELQKIIRSHFIADQSISSEIVKDATKEYISMNEEKPVHFSSYLKDDHYMLSVEGDGVNASVVQANIGATNGIIHIIDKVLGVSVQTIKEKLSSDQRLRISYDVTEMSSGNWNSRLDNMDAKYTIFVPSTDAWELIKNTMPSEYKQLIQGIYPQNAETILDRHIIMGKILNTNDLQENMELDTARGTIVIKRDALNRLIVKWEDVEAVITRPNVQAINGIIHEIDKVLMKKKDMAVSPALALNDKSSGTTLAVKLLPTIILIFIAKLI